MGRLNGSAHYRPGTGLFNQTWYDSKPWSWHVDDHAYTGTWSFTEEPELDGPTLERALRGELGARSLTCCSCRDELECVRQLAVALDRVEPEHEHEVWARRRLREL
jgi:hypothetical protein